MELAYPPFEMTDEQGRPDGISVALAEALGKFLGREVEIQNTAFDGLIPALKTGKIDLIISSMTATPNAPSPLISPSHAKDWPLFAAGQELAAGSIQDLDQPEKAWP